MKDRIDINSDAVSLRRELGEDVYSPIDIFSLLGSADDLTVVFYPMSERISGACIRDNGNKIIVINSSLSYGRQRFTAAHELCHLYFHDQFKSVVCAKDIDNVKNPQAIEADILAMSLEAGFIDEATGNTIWGNMIKRRRMMPTATFSEYLQKRNASSKSTVDL